MDVRHLAAWIGEREESLASAPSGPFKVPESDPTYGNGRDFTPGVAQESLPAGMTLHEHLWYPDDMGLGGDDKVFTEHDRVTREVPTQDLVTPQDNVDARRLNQIWNDPSTSEGNPQVVHEPATDKYHITDGNHRATVARHDNQMFTQVDVHGTYDGNNGPVQPQSPEYKAEWARSGDPVAQGGFDWQPRNRNLSEGQFS